MPSDPAFSRVRAARGAEADALVPRVLSGLTLPDLKGKTVLLKPNAGREVGPRTGINTCPEVVAAAVTFFRERGARVLVGDSTIMGTDGARTLASSGIGEAAVARGADLVDLDAPPALDTPIPGGWAIDTLKICAPVREADFLVSIPVMKTHMHTVVSLGVKNLKGCLRGREKIRLHQIPRTERHAHLKDKLLDVAISDLYTVLKPDLVLVDGLFGLEGLGPSAGDRKEPGLVVASRDALAADSLACRLMGIDPARVPHLRLCAERGLGNLDPGDIDPADWTGWVVPFALPPQDLSIKHPGVKVYDCDSCSACVSTAMLFIKRYEALLHEYQLDDGQFHMAIGKALPEDIPEGTLLIGNCTANRRGKGVFVPGCPPVGSFIWETLEKTRKPEK